MGLVRQSKEQEAQAWQIKIELMQLAAKCYYCKKGHGIFSKKMPIHPADRALIAKDLRDRFGGFYEDGGEELEESVKALKIWCCEKCWRSRVAGVGLTVATGDKRLDTNKVISYLVKARERFGFGEFSGALEEIFCARELALKSLDTDLGYEAHELAGDCYAGLGEREEALRELSLALKIFEEAPIKAGGATAWGVLYTAKEAWSRGSKQSELKAKIQKLRE